MGCYCVLGGNWLGDTGTGGDNGGCGGTEFPRPLGSRCLDLTESNCNPKRGGEGTGDNENTCCAP